MNKPTAHHFKVFQQEAKKWIAKFGLVGWEIVFAREDIQGRAACRLNMQSRCAGLVLANDFKGDLTDEEMRRSAFHEVCEILLARTWFICMNSDLTPRQRESHMEEARHEIIRILENTVWSAK